MMHPIQFGWRHIASLVTLSLFFQLFSAELRADCSNCKTLRRSAFLGIKSTKQYLSRPNQVTILSNARKAKKRGLSKYTGCNQANSTSKKKSDACAPVFAVISDGIYLCPRQLKPFKDEAKAISKGFGAYAACATTTPTPTPTATPQVTPKPLNRTFSLESGSRISDIDALSVVRLPNNSYRAFIAPSINTLDPDTLRYTDSADGLTFGSISPLTGISPETSETFAFPTAVVLEDNSFVLLYEDVKHLSTGGLDVFRLMRATSADGINFSLNPSDVAISDGSTFSNYFEAHLTKIGTNQVRLYYLEQSNIQSRLTNDFGITWSDKQQVSVLGRSDTFAPFLGEASIIIDNSGTYFMAFASQPNQDPGGSSIYMADSNDGITFHVFNQTLADASSGVSHIDPSVILLPDGRIRIYVVERTGSFPSVSRAVNSYISD